MSLSDRLDADRPEAWQPEPGEKIVGTIVEISTGVSKPEYGGEQYPIIVVRTDDGEERTVYCSRSVLKSEIVNNAPSVGDEVGIKYLGIPDGKRYESYRVVLERKSPKPTAPSAPAPAPAPAEQSDDEMFGS